ncbi:MAG TPA: VWA domain-containing protein [Thermoanaerobaculia bacterium]|nr:VWA domain-containing protein [Thermoanaerobaculia bacterium]
MASAAALLAMIGAVGGARELRLRPVALPEAYFRARLAEVRPLLVAEELAAFARLDDDRQRLAFLDGAWSARDPTPETPRNEARLEHEARLRVAYERLGTIAATDPDDARLQLIGLLGDPDEVLSAQGAGASTGPGVAARSPLAAGDGGLAVLQVPPECPTPPVEVFVYHARGARPALFVLLLRTDAGWRLHDRRPLVDGALDSAVLGTLRRRRCEPVLGRYAEAVERALKRPLTWERVLARAEPPSPSARWLEALRSGDEVLAQAPDGAGATAELRAAFTSRRVETTASPRSPGRVRRHSVIDVEAQLEVAVDPARLGARPWWALRLRGEVLSRAGRRSGVVIHRFAHDRLVPSSPDGVVVLPFAFSAPPGEQLLVLDLADASGEWSAVTAFELAVPLQPSAGALAVAPETASLHARLDRLPSVRLRLPGMLLVGEQPVRAITRGDVARVEYRLDGEPAVVVEADPFEARLDFGRLPLERSLAAIGFDRTGRQVAVDRVTVNPGLQRLRLDLVEVGRLGEAIRVRGRLTQPVGSQLDRVEWFLDDRRLAVATAEPLIAILPLAPAGEASPRFVRAVAHLEDGRRVEDTRFLDSDAMTERVRVDLVQLFVRVSDRRGRQIADLDAAEVTVLERGEPQALRTFERATDLPLQLALLVDVSGTMASQIGLVRSAASAFLERVLRAGDQGAILSFRTAPEVMAPFGPKPEWMSDTLVRFQAWGGTALWDSLALTAYYAQGLPGKKAVVAVTDGRDHDSELGPAEVEELAQRLGVAIYVIGLGIAPPTQVQLNATTIDRRRAVLDRLCESTGGSFHAALGEKGLAAALGAIERELRSQYVITFQVQGEDAGFRPIEVRVARPGVRASTMAGYYP